MDESIQDFRCVKVIFWICLDHDNTVYEPVYILYICMRVLHICLI